MKNLAQLITGQTHVIVEKSVAKENDQSSQKKPELQELDYFGTNTKEE